MVLTDLPGNCNIDEHEIKLTSDEPIRSRLYQLPHATKYTVKQEVKPMLEMNVISCCSLVFCLLSFDCSFCLTAWYLYIFYFIEAFSSPYASPVVLVKTTDGSNRFCIDFRKLNAITVFDAEAMPDPEEFFSKISKSKYFTKIDLIKGYFQISVGS